MIGCIVIKKKEREEMKKMDLNTLFNLLEEIAEKEADGHITIMKFTTGWKAAFATPDLDAGEGRKQIEKLKKYETLEKAIKDLIIEKTNLLNI
jgi:hypothetical protein